MLGDQGASIEAAAIAYDVLAAALMAEAAQMAATTGATAADGFIGAGGTAMMATAIPYIAALADARRVGGAVGGRRGGHSAGLRHREGRDDPGAGLRDEPGISGRLRRDEHHRPEHARHHRPRHGVLRFLLAV